MFGHSNLGDSEKYRGAFIEWREEWSQFFTPCNWRTFHPAFIEFEDDRMMGAVECTIIILGLGFRLRWNYAITRQVADVQQSIKDIEAGTAETTPLSEFLTDLKK